MSLGSTPSRAKNTQKKTDLQGTSSGGAPTSKNSKTEPPTVEQTLGEFADVVKHAVDEVNKRAGRDLFVAVLSGLALISMAAACLLWFPWGLVIVVALAIGGAQIEVGQVIRKLRGVRIAYVPLIVGSVLFTLAAYASRMYPDTFSSMSMWAIAGLTVVVILVVRLRGPVEGYLADIAHTLMLFGYPGLLAVSVVLMLAEEQGPALTFAFLLTVAATDTGGHLLGMAIGKHPVAPRISPKKSWEGLIGSVLLACASGLVTVIFLLHDDWWKGIILALVIVVVGFLGDLVESQIKRDLGIKDMGNLIPGHGGIMDRMDSYILAAFPAWLVIMWLFPGG
jgi:phosphatidate cytidylyltransferase